MKKARLIVGVTAAVPVAVGGFAAPAAAHVAQPTTAKAHQAPVTGKTVLNHAAMACTNCGPGWYQITGGVMYNPNGGIIAAAYNGWAHITCYYKGNTGFTHDPYFDHFVSMSFPRTGRQPAVGHVADQYVDLGNHLPTSFGIPHC